jgi:hypothetical protein
MQMSGDATLSAVTDAGGQDHLAQPIDGSAYRIGVGNCTGTRAWLANSNHYPAEAVCGFPGCSQVLRCDQLDRELRPFWYHTGRLAGQPPKELLTGCVNPQIPFQSDTATPGHDTSPPGAPEGPAVIGRGI